MEDKKPMFALPQIPRGIEELVKSIPDPQRRDESSGEEGEEYDEVDININGSTFRFVCEFCGRGFNKKSAYANHVETHGSNKMMGGSIRCQFCDIEFGSKMELENHDCKPSTINEFQSYTGRQSSMHHQINGAYVCSVCGKQFNQRYHLQTHMASHTGNKPFSCMICGKAFARKDVLGVHMKVHSDVKEFQCEVCGARFKQRYHLTRHMNTHLERVDVVCDFCGQVFHRLDRYNQHIKRVHIGRQDSNM
ncbi:C2H2 type domain-containing protein [Hexamita inflata]|uniref:C2H2 type domain-containing protein n=1 Tax=Hexamita inflata TaxID=28002 RepID=A0AA86N4Z6_9EUKA|nr:C2H2 type domain-containing protein [Hexamita inflata]